MTEEEVQIVELLRALGTFWTTLVNDLTPVEAVLAAVADSGNQDRQALQELAAATSRQQIKPLTRIICRPLKWQRTDLVIESSAKEYRSDPAINFETISEHTFGRRDLTGYYKLPLSLDVKHIPVMTRTLATAGRAIICGLDYVIEPGWIVFRENPFTDDVTELTLFAHEVSSDQQDLHLQFGYTLGVQLPSTDAGKRFMNAIMDANLYGASETSVIRAWGAILDVPICDEEETVREIITDAGYRNVITDRRVYRLPLAATPSVSVGQTVHVNQPLSQALTFIDLRNKPDVPISGISLNSGYLAREYGELVFSNEDVELSVSTEDGFTRVEFPLGGQPARVKAFWDCVHQRGIAANRTLAHILDLRESKIGEPTADSLPKTVNPLRFLLDRLMRNHLYLLIVKPSQRGSDSLPLQWSALIRQIIPPHTAWIVAIALEHTDSPAIMDNRGSLQREGYSETFVIRNGIGGIDVVTPDFVAEKITIKGSGPTCDT